MTNNLENKTNNWKIYFAKDKLSRAKDELKENLRDIVLYGTLTLGCWGFAGYQLYNVMTNSEYKQIQKTKIELNEKIGSIENICTKYIQANDTINYFNNLNKNIINKDGLSRLISKERKYNNKGLLGLLALMTGFFGLVPFLGDIDFRPDYKTKKEEAEKELNKITKNDKQN